MRRLGNRGRGEFEVEVVHFEIVERLAVAGKLEPAGDEPRFLELLQVQMQERTADADLARELADVVASAGGQRGDDAQPVRAVERRQRRKQLVSRGRHVRSSCHVSILSDACKEVKRNRSPSLSLL